MSKEAMKLALEALTHLQPTALTSFYTIGDRDKAITALREALAEQPAQQEPVAWWNGNSKFATPKAKDWDKRTGGTTAFGCDIPLYTAPPQRTWVGLTDEEQQATYDAWQQKDDGWGSFYNLIEAKLKEKNT